MLDWEMKICPMTPIRSGKLNWRHETKTVPCIILGPRTHISPIWLGGRGFNVSVLTIWDSTPEARVPVEPEKRDSSSGFSVEMTPQASVKPYPCQNKTWSTSHQDGAFLLQTTTKRQEVKEYISLYASKTSETYQKQPDNKAWLWT